MSKFCFRFLRVFVLVVSAVAVLISAFERTSSCGRWTDLLVGIHGFLDW